VTWGLFGLAALAVIVVIFVPAVMGAQRYTILGGSMEPSIPLGSLVVVQPKNIADVRVGNVVTFQVESGKAAVATHRVVGTGDQGGIRLLVTQGDANAAVDIEPVRGEQLRGVVIYTLPLVGWINVVISGEARKWSVPIVGGALVLYSGWMLASAWRDHRRRQESTVTDTDSSMSSTAPDGSS
jgi:signal peptidase